MIGEPSGEATMLIDPVAWPHSLAPAAEPGESLDAHRRRRAAAEAAADHAESQASEAARRAASAIAAAARAADEAEAAAAAAERLAERAEVERAAEVAYTSRLPVVSPTPAADGADRPAVADLAVDPFEGPRPAPALRSSAAARPRHVRHEPVGIPLAVPAPRGADAVTELIPVVPDGDGTSRHRRRSTDAGLRAAAVARAAAQDPDTAVIRRSADDGEEMPAPGVVTAPPRSRHGRRDATAPFEDAGDPGPAEPDGGTETGSGPRAVARLRGVLRSRRGRAAAVAGAAVLVVAAGAAVAGAALRAPTGAAAPSPVVEAATAASATQAAPVTPDEADPQSPKAVAFLKALRKAGVPVSTSGLTETQAAELICDRIGTGTSDAALARSLPAVLPTVTADEAPAVVGAARKNYC